MALKDEFERIFIQNEWGSNESKSGIGSELRNTTTLVSELPFIMYKYGIGSILDIPCGDLNWMQHVLIFDRLEIDYHGADIVPAIIEKNKLNFPNKEFSVLDITKDPLPKVDLVFVRDCLGHFSDANIFKALDNIIASGSKYLLVTSFTSWNISPDISDGQWKPINLMIHPYYLRPIYLINEDCQEGYPNYNDKCMILIDLRKPFNTAK